MTLVEALLSIVILGMTAGGISALFTSGLQTLEQGQTVMLLQSALRSQMETVISRPFGEVLAEATGGEIITVDGQDYKAYWTATNIDLDGDTSPEANAMLVEVFLDGRSLSVILVDNEGRVGAVP